MIQINIDKYEIETIQYMELTKRVRGKWNLVKIHCNLK